MKDTIVESVVNQFKQRSEVGIKKYGVTLDRTDLSFLEWMQHAQEEAMDLCLYLEKIKQELKPTESKGGLEYLISEILDKQQMHIDEVVDYIENPKIQYVNSYKSCFDLSYYVKRAREIDMELKEQKETLESHSYFSNQNGCYSQKITKWYDEKLEERINIIGQNGNDGEHYNK